MPKLRFIKENVSVDTTPDTTLLEAMRQAGLVPNAPCGGQGKCGKCRVYIENTHEYVLSCQTKAGDKDLNILTVDDDEKNVSILEKSLNNTVKYLPHIERAEITVPPCPLGKSISEWSRFTKALYESIPHLNGRVKPDPIIASKLPKAVKPYKGKVHVLYSNDEILDVSSERKAFYMVGFDIGTTTVVGYLLNGEDGKMTAVASRLNPQVQFGADVISRASYSLEFGENELTDCIRNAVNELIGELCMKAGCQRDDIYMISVAGNTCMHHLFFGIDVDSLVHAPYNPAICENMILSSKAYGIDINEKGQILALPNIAGFVGADTVACIVSSDIAKQKEWTLLIDIGTNGEMVLSKDHKMAACSTAAGPAFEGVGISNGMRGAEGAISHAKYTNNGWKLEIINDKPAIGICGSGLLDLASEMLRTGLMNEDGQMEKSKIVLVPADKSGNGQEVFICQKDIRELQMAKAAIRAGIMLLAKHVGIEVDEIRQVWLAGAFGNFLNPQNVCRIGMIPPVLRDRITPIGNAAGLGAQMVLQSKELWMESGNLASKTDFLELATLPEFQDTFVDALEFDNF